MIIEKNTMKQKTLWMKKKIVYFKHFSNSSVYIWKYKNNIKKNIHNIKINIIYKHKTQNVNTKNIKT